jgi:hypothetical protein
MSTEIQDRSNTLQTRTYKFSLDILKQTSKLPNTKSANETVYCLNLLKDSGLAKADEVDVLLREALELSKMLGKSVLTLKAKKF